MFLCVFLCVFSAFIEHNVAISPSSFSSVSREKGLLCYMVVYSSYLLSQYSVEADSLHVCSNCLPWFSETNHSWLILQGRSSLGNPVNSYDFRCLFSFLDVCPHYLDFNPLNYDIQIILIMCCFWVCSYIYLPLSLHSISCVSNTRQLASIYSLHNPHNKSGKEIQF